MTKEDLLRMLQPFTDEVEILVRLADGETFRPVYNAYYGQTVDHEGVVYLTFDNTVSVEIKERFK